MSLTLYLYPGYPKYLLTYLFLEKCTFVWITYVKKWLCICCNFFLFLPINNFVVTETIKVTGQLQFICTFIAEYTQHGMLVTIPQCNFDSGIPKIFKVFYASVEWICLGIPKKCIVGYSLTSLIVQVLSFSSSNLLCMECDDVILRLAVLVPLN